MAETKIAKLKRFEATRQKIRIDLAIKATHHELDKSGERYTSVHRGLVVRPGSNRNRQDNNQKHLFNLKKKEIAYTRKIDKLRAEIYGTPVSN